MRVGHVGQGLAFEAPVTGLAGEREHVLGLRMGLVQALGRGQDLAAPLMDIRQPHTWDRGHAARGLEGPGVQVQRHRVGVGVARSVAGAHQVLEGLGPVLALREVVSQLFVVLGQPVGIELLKGVAHRLVQGAAPLAEQAVVGHVLDDGVLEDVGGLGQEALLVDDLEGLQLAQEPVELPAHSGHPPQQPDEELPSDDGGELHSPLAVVAEPVESGHDDVVDGAGHADLRPVLDERDAIAVAAQHADVEQGLGDLLDEQRHAFRLLHEGRGDLGGQVSRPEHPAGHRERLAFAERGERDGGLETARPERRRVAHAIGQDQQERGRRHGVDQ